MLVILFLLLFLFASHQLSQPNEQKKTARKIFFSFSSIITASQVFVGFLVICLFLYVTVEPEQSISRKLVYLAYFCTVAVVFIFV